MNSSDEPTEIDTGTADLIATRRDGVLTLTLNRPERRNAMTAAFDLASRLANGPQAALRAMKANLLNAGRLDLEPAMDLEVTPHMTCGVAEDHRNAVAAFVEKRTPVFAAAWRRP